jgi:putative DNA primase/helicase
MSESLIPLMIYKSETDNRGERRSGTREKWQTIFGKHSPRPLKKGHIAFSPGVLRTGATRSSNSVERISALVADIDDGFSLDELKPAITQFSWIAYSSYSHFPAEGKFKFRLVFFLTRICTVQEWSSVWAGMNQLLGGHCDPACKDPSRLYFLPSCPQERLSDAFAVSNVGELIDPDYLRGLAPSESDMQVTNALAVSFPKQAPPEEAAEEIEKVKSMLATISADCGRADWITVCWGLAATGWACAQELARNWSASSTKFDAADFQRVWNDFTPAQDKAVGYGSLIHLARQHGWQPQTIEGLIEQTPGDVLAGRAYAKLNRELLLWVAQAGQWLRWDGSRWVWCACGQEMATAKQVADRLLALAAKLYSEDPERHKRRMHFAMGLQNIRRLEAMIELAKSEPGMAVGHMSELDADAWQLGCRNGVINLRTGTLLQAAPEMRITRQIATEYRAEVTCPHWMEFLDSIFDHDTATVEFIQRALGYTLTGVTTEEVLFICFGSGANGKSVFANVLSTVFADYSQMAPQALLTVRREGDSGPRNDVARLCGSRLVQINELNQGDRLDEQIVKMLAGREMLSARFLHKEYFDFWPTAKPWLRTNHRPIITGEDDGIWRRIMLIPFRRKFAEHERDPWLESKLLEERDGILAWMVAGCLDWQRHGLKPSALVKRESATYRKESDLLGEFLDERTRPDSNEKVEQGRLFEQWRRWCEDNGTRHGSKAGFSRKLSERGYVEGKSNGTRFYAGLKLCAVVGTGQVGRV